MGMGNVSQKNDTEYGFLRPDNAPTEEGHGTYLSHVSGINNAFKLAARKRLAELENRTIRMLYGVLGTFVSPHEKSLICEQTT